MDKKIYSSPKLTVTAFISEDVITASGLVNGGANGKPLSEDFGSLFGGN